MARIINFYIPASYRHKTKKQTPPAERGKLISFSSALRVKSAWRILIAGGSRSPSPITCGQRYTS